MLFGNRLLNQRKKLGISAEVFARMIGISRSYVTLMENNHRHPGTDILKKIADALGIKVNVVLNWYLEDARERIKKELGEEG